MDRYELKRITQGKFRKASLVFHVVDQKLRRNYELLVDHINSNSFTLRCVKFDVWRFKRVLMVTLLFRCLNSWKSKSHEACKARYTLFFNNDIKQLIVKDETGSKKKISKVVFKLVELDNDVLYDHNNYTLACKKCPRTVVCSRHSHI